MKKLKFNLPKEKKYFVHRTRKTSTEGPSRFLEINICAQGLSKETKKAIGEMAVALENQVFINNKEKTNNGI